MQRLLPLHHMLSLNYMRQKSFTLLEKFIDNGLNLYSSRRNYDFGEENRSNVSLLSPYIRKRIVHEKEAILKCLKEFSYSKIEKIYSRNFLEIILERLARGKRNFVERI